MDKAQRWEYTPTTTAKVGSSWYWVNGGYQRDITIKVNDTVTFSWNSLGTAYQCRVMPADWSELDGSISTPWKGEKDSYTTEPFTRTGVYTYQLVCDPGFAVGDEPEVVTVRVTATGEGTNTPPPTNGAGSKPKSKSGAVGYGVLILLAGFVWLRGRRLR